MQIKTLVDILSEDLKTNVADKKKSAHFKTNKQYDVKTDADQSASGRSYVSNKSVSAKQQRLATKQTAKPKTNATPTPSGLDIKAILQAARQEAGVDTQADPKKQQDQQSHRSADIEDTTDSLTPPYSSVDNLPDALKAYLRTPEERQAEKDAIKDDSRLRWLAFYYLSLREHSAQELKQKLLAKDQHPDKVDALLLEFRNKGYQSDHRTALMLIKEGIRKGRGRRRIEQDFYAKKLDVPSNIDELIEMAISDDAGFGDTVTNDDSLVDGVDWLKLAVEARVKKYGEDIPTEQKDKARQLRFLQYRGFTSDICFEALKHDLTSVKERF